MAVKIKTVEKDDPCDVIIVTSDGQMILAHSSILASASAVLERKIKRAKKRWNFGECRISVLGVSLDAIVAFVKLLYSYRAPELSTTEIDHDVLLLEKYGMQILALSHQYRIGWLKRRCEISISTLLTPERVIDTLKLAKLLDAPRLHQQCMQLVQKDFESVRKTEGWRFVRRNDPVLELEILEYLEEVDERKRRWKKAKEAQESYRQLGEAIDILEQFFTKRRTQNQINPFQSQTCQNLQLLLQHFVKCERKFGSRGCVQCKRMSQLLKLYDDICDKSGACMVRVLKVKRDEKLEKTWRLLVENVSRARVMSSLASRRKPNRIDVDIV